LGTVLIFEIEGLEEGVDTGGSGVDGGVGERDTGL